MPKGEDRKICGIISKGNHIKQFFADNPNRIKVLLSLLREQLRLVEKRPIASPNGTAYIAVTKYQLEMLVSCVGYIDTVCVSLRNLMTNKLETQTKESVWTAHHHQCWLRDHPPARQN